MLRRRPQPVISRPLAALFGLVVAVAGVAMVVPLWPGQDSIGIGNRSPTDLEAAQDAQYESAVLTAAARDRAASEVQPELRPIDPRVREDQIALLLDALDEVTIVRQRSDLDQQQRITTLSAITEVSGISSAGQVALLGLSSTRYTSMRTTLRGALESVLSGPIVEESDVEPAIESYLTAIAENNSSTLDAEERTVIKEVLRAFVVPNVEIDEAATEQARENARANVNPVVQTWSAGQVIAQAGVELDAAQVEALRETGVIETGLDIYDAGAGVIIALVLGAMLGSYLYLFQPVPEPARRPLVLIGLTLVLALGATRLALPQLIPDVDGRFFAFALPVAAAAMTTAAFSELSFGVIVAAAVGLFSAFIAATAPDLAGASFISPLESLELAFAYTAGGLAGAATVFRADRLSRFAASAVAVALATAAVLVAFWFLDQNRINEELGWIAVASAAAGIGSAVLAVGIIVILSNPLGVTTRLQLLELAQANSPLLRRLQDEAPGTYHHSMLVGALAERAAEQIGADPLVTRAGAYYHDIGKLAQPEYYIENIFPGSSSPHDALPEEESAAKIIEHVTSGVELARKHRLPAIVREFIPQHHGTRLVIYFYRQARNKGLEPDPARFQYAGPRPKTKEAAIVMLADSCEAVVRAGMQRDSDQIGTAVDSVFAERLAEGQLDECDITMREVNAVADSFKSTLRAVYHQRIEYPAQEPEIASPAPATAD